MTLEEAREFYFQYCGFSFHMDREEPVKYWYFTRLNLGKDVLRQWDEELLDNHFRRLCSDWDHVWTDHGRILDIIRRNNCDVEKYLNRLLDVMAHMERLDLFNITLILENMAGRTEPMRDGGVYVVCKYSDLAPKMNDITEHLITACQKTRTVDERFEKAVNRYRSAYHKWARS